MTNSKSILESIPEIQDFREGYNYFSLWVPLTCHNGARILVSFHADFPLDAEAHITYEGTEWSDEEASDIEQFIYDNWKN